jgi:hypothetical protein
VLTFTDLLRGFFVGRQSMRADRSRDASLASE